MKEPVGGQALIEGVMMRCGKKKAIAIRKSNGEILTTKLKPHILFENSVIYQIPFIRGIFVLINSMIEGSKDLTYSASFFMEDEENSKLEQLLENVFWKVCSKNSRRSNICILFFSCRFPVCCFTYNDSKESIAKYMVYLA